MISRCVIINFPMTSVIVIYTKVKYSFAKCKYIENLEKIKNFLYEQIGVVRPQLQIKPPDDEDTTAAKTPKSTAATKVVSNNTKTGGNVLVGATTTGELYI